jgi:hypothetical protein
MECITCQMIAMVDKGYPKRRARFGKTNLRCTWHAWGADEVWRCDVCGKYTHAETVSCCVRKNKFVCTTCATSQKKKDGFWLWKSFLELKCPFCGESHPVLPRQEFCGEHPWQADPFSCQDFPIWYPGGGLIEEKDAREP